MRIMGIDGGGTHTRVELRDEHNQMLFRKEFGAFNVNAIGEDAFRELLRQVFAHCGVGDVSRLCAGGAGASNPEMGRILGEELDMAGFSGIWKLCGDQEIALRGAMEGPGAAVIAGTGSICFGKNAAGETARSGGYGHLIDDGGSGYALGRDVLAGAVRQADGRREGWALLQRVYEKLKASRPEDIVSFVYHPDTRKSDVAAFSFIALELAEAGDPEAEEILRRGAEELAQMVEAVQRCLGLEGCGIALLGGLLSQDNVYRKMVCDRLKMLGTPIYPAHDALWGAAQMAWEMG